MLLSQPRRVRIISFCKDENDRGDRIYDIFEMDDVFLNGGGFRAAFHQRLAAAIKEGAITKIAIEFPKED